MDATRLAGRRNIRNFKWKEFSLQYLLVDCCLLLLSTRIMGESDFKISRLLDESLETTLKSVGYGFCIGTGVAAVLFRKLMIATLLDRV